MKNQHSPIFKVIFRKGLAERNRLPLEHVIRTLQELDAAIREVGREVQKARGVENPTGDFGLELLAGRGGFIFRKGSLQALSAATRDLENAAIAVTRVIHTADLLDRKQPASLEPSVAPVIHRFARLSGWQRETKTELKLEWLKPGERAIAARFGEAAIQTIDSISAPDMIVEAVTLFGKLRQLKDLTKELDEEGNAFWGELVTDGGESWRIRFPNAELRNVLPLFRKQVAVTGDAKYFQARNPRLDAKKIALDAERDYTAAFDKYQGSDADDFGDIEVQDLLKELRG